MRKGGDPKILDYLCDNNKIQNNIIWRTGNDGWLVVEKGCENDLLLSNNIFWKTGGSGEFKIFGKWYGANQFMPFEFHENSHFVDPQFVRPGENFALLPTSPGIDAGIFISGEVYKGKGIDIGAVENYAHIKPPLLWVDPERVYRSGEK